MDIIKIYTGTEITVNLLKAELEEAGIGALVRNDFASGVASGFVGGVPSAIDLYVQQTDFLKANEIVKGFREING